MTESRDVNSISTQIQQAQTGSKLAKPLWAAIVVFFVLIAPWSITKYSQAIEDLRNLAARKTIETTHVWEWKGSVIDGPTVTWFFMPSRRVIVGPKGDELRICFVRGIILNQHSQALLEARSVSLSLLDSHGIELFQQNHKLNKVLYESKYSDRHSDLRIGPGESWAFQFSMEVPSALIPDVRNLAASLSFQLQTPDGQPYSRK